MSKLVFSNKGFQRWLFLLGGAAFLLSLLKNLFLEQHPGVTFYMVELLAFLFFLSAFFVSDNNNQQLRKNIRDFRELFEQDRKGYLNKINQLKEIVAGYEQKENEAIRFASYQDRVIEKLTSDKKVLNDKHYFLHLLSELFHGMAVVLYKKNELSGSFAVEASYGLPEEFVIQPFVKGEGLHGQAVEAGSPALVEDIPEDYVPVHTGLGSSRNYFLYMLPVMANNDCTGLIELMTFRETDIQRLWPGVMEKLIEGDVL